LISAINWCYYILVYVSVNCVLREERSITWEFEMVHHTPNFETVYVFHAKYEYLYFLYLAVQLVYWHITIQVTPNCITAGSRIQNVNSNQVNKDANKEK